MLIFISAELEHSVELDHSHMECDCEVPGNYFRLLYFDSFKCVFISISLGWWQPPQKRQLTKNCEPRDYSQPIFRRILVRIQKLLPLA